MGCDVSVIIPVYNSEKFLEDCVHSVINQTFSNIEIILVNDGSKDKSADICDTLAIKDSRIRVIHKTNSGVSDTRNVGINEAIGRYVTFIDSDDVVELNYIEKLYREILNSDIDCVVCGFNICRGISKVSQDYKRPVLLSSEDDEYGIELMHLYQGKLLNPIWNKMYVKESMPGFNVNLAMGEDVVFNLEYFSKTKKIKVIPDVLYNYRVHEGSAVTTPSLNRMKDVIVVNNFMIDSFSNILTEKNIKKIIKVCVGEVDGLYRHLFRMSASKNEIKNIINCWRSCEEYAVFFNSFARKNLIYLASANTIYRFYYLRTIGERTIIKMFRQRMIVK
ncbi:MAG: glycosyltransferase family 2 protein [Clostridia bacterium]|nr:glycosyltransferase family 2 protein [Clostridia bacterium]